MDFFMVIYIIDLNTIYLYCFGIMKAIHFYFLISSRMKQLRQCFQATERVSLDTVVVKTMDREILFKFLQNKSDE